MCQECQEIEVGYSESSEAWDQTVEYGSEEKVLNSGIKEEVSGKVCTKCGEWKPLGKFRKDKYKVGGYRSYCKKCSNKYERYRESDLFVPLRDLYVVLDPKVCTICGLSKSLEDYYLNSRCRDGHTGACKDCTNNYRMDLSKKNKEKFILLGKVEVKMCSDCLLTKPSSEFYSNPLSKDGLSYVCKLCTNARYRPFGDVPVNSVPYVEGKKICSRCTEEKDMVEFGVCKYHTDGRTSQCKACDVKRVLLFRQTDVQYRLRAALRKRLHYYIESGGELCSADALAFLGCTVEELKLRLERYFYVNPETNEMMSWDNYGAYGWHIDHIVPLAVFDLNDPDQVRYACRFDNLRPLWREANLSKGSKFDEDWEGYEEYQSLLMFEEEMRLQSAV